VDWRAGVAAERLILEGKIPPLIIVGIDNTAKAGCGSTFLPVVELRLFDARETLSGIFAARGEPMIEKYYRVAKGPEHTGWAGRHWVD